MIHKAKASKAVRRKARLDAAAKLVQVKILHPVLHFRAGHVASVSADIAKRLKNHHVKHGGPVRACLASEWASVKAARVKKHEAAVAAEKAKASAAQPAKGKKAAAPAAEAEASK